MKLREKAKRRRRRRPTREKER